MPSRDKKVSSTEYGNQALDMTKMATLFMFLLGQGLYVASPALAGGCRPLFFDDLTSIFCDHRERDLMVSPKGFNTKRIETERHDFTQSVETVGRGIAQVECGCTYFCTDTAQGSQHAHATPELMRRYGLTEHIEFRIRTNYVWERGVENRNGSEDLRLSFKLGISEFKEQHPFFPESALEVRFTAPTASDTFSTNRIQFGLDYIYGWPIGEFFELYGSTGYSTTGLGDFALVGEPADGDSFNTWTQSVAVGVELTEKTTVFSELFGICTDKRDNDLSLAFYNLGVDYYVTDDLVLDIRVGSGITGDSEDLFVGFGGGFRY